MRLIFISLWANSVDVYAIFLKPCFVSVHEGLHCVCNAESRRLPEDAHQERNYNNRAIIDVQIQRNMFWNTLVHERRCFNLNFKDEEGFW